MYTIYSLIADPEWAEIATLLILGLTALGYLSFVWGNAHRLNTRLTNFQWAKVYILGFFVFFCGIIIFGKFIVPENTDSLMQTLGTDYVLEWITSYVQAVLLAILRPLI